MANLLHQNKKMTVFEALEILEALEYKYSYVAGESVSTANVIIFPRKNNNTYTDKDDKNDVNCNPDSLCGRQLLSDAKLDLQQTGGTKLITNESQALASGQEKFCIFSCFWNTRLSTGDFQPKYVSLTEQCGGPPATKKVTYIRILTTIL